MENDPSTFGIQQDALRTGRQSKRCILDVKANHLLNEQDSNDLLSLLGTCRVLTAIYAVDAVGRVQVSALIAARQHVMGAAEQTFS